MMKKMILILFLGLISPLCFAHVDTVGLNHFELTILSAKNYPFLDHFKNRIDFKYQCIAKKRDQNWHRYLHTSNTGETIVFHSPSPVLICGKDAWGGHHEMTAVSIGIFPKGQNPQTLQILSDLNQTAHSTIKCSIHLIRNEAGSYEFKEGRCERK